MTWKGKWPGTWAVNCDVCGFRFPSNKLRKRWDGVMACEKDWETRHPQTLIKVRGETAVPEYTRHNPDEYTFVCTIVTSSGYAGLGTAGCMQAGNTRFPYQYLIDWGKNGHEGIPSYCSLQSILAYAGVGAAGCMKAGNTSLPY